MCRRTVKFPISRSTANAGRIMTAAMSDDPFALFDSWLAEARAGEPNDANAMALATTTPDGHPSLRMVLLKGHGPDGFVFYTNLDSRKGGELAARSEEHTSELQSLMRISYAVFCLKKKKQEK